MAERKYSIEEFSDQESYQKIKPRGHTNHLVGSNKTQSLQQHLTKFNKSALASPPEC